MTKSKKGDNMNNFEDSVQASHDAQLAELTVLKEKQQDKPEHIKETDFCNFCNNNSSDQNGFFLIKNRLYFRRFKTVLGDMNINFCPVCGRKLVEI